MTFSRKITKTTSAQKALLLSSLLLALTGCGNDSDAELEQISYSLQVKPILSDRCFQCHGQDTANRKADLQLHTAETAYKPLEDGGQPIVPGNAEDSVAYQRIISTDPEFVMPPVSSHIKVSSEEAEIIRQWINQGAKYEKHWAYFQPTKSPLPQVAEDTWSTSDVDNFVLAKMTEQGLTPAEKADKATLIRRAFIDLIGIIPTVEQLDKYMQDERADYFTHLVDDLLASPSFGEHMAATWLDLARYGDTHGFQDDGNRQMWPWRNWVINAFNNNMPFDQFMMQQLAGDLMPNPTQEMILATGFNRNSQLNGEGGVIAEEFRVEYIADKVNVTSTAFLGHTVGCARCHDHKYDPVSQKDFYKMFAFFNNTPEKGFLKAVRGAHPPYINYFWSEKDKQGLNDIVAKIADTNSELFNIENQHFDTYQQQVKAEVASLDNKVVTELAQANVLHAGLEDKDEKDNDALLIAGKFGKAMRIGVKQATSGYVHLGHSVKLKNTDPFAISAWTRVADVVKHPRHKRTELPFSIVEQIDTANDLKGYSLSVIEKGHIELSLIASWPKDALVVRSIEPLDQGQAWKHVYAQYDGSGKAAGIKLFINGAEVATKTIKNNLQGDINNSKEMLSGWGPDRNKLGRARAHDVDEIRFVQGENLSLAAIKALSTASPVALAAAINGSVAKPSIENRLPQEYFVALSEHGEKTNTWFDLTRQKSQLINNKSVAVMVMDEFKGGLIRPTYLLNRGSYDAPDKSEELTADIPSYFGSLGDDLPKNRLGLATWLASNENPLTARVMVNRYWQSLFGQGIVKTSENFGIQGSLPSHAKLLDWLAVEFVDSGWDIKHMYKLMMLSSTYQQSSVLPNTEIINDPENIYLSRGPLYRMSAEVIRDSALQGATLLSKNIGGRSVKPYQPEGLWKQVTTNAEYKQSKKDGLYRRGLYTFLKRTIGVPSMSIFDASTRDECISRRQATNTPLQALVLLNDPQYVEASRVLAEHTLVSKQDTVERINFIGRSLLSRDLSITEISELSALYNDMLADYQTDEASAQALLNIGDKKVTNKGANSISEIAAYTIVASAVMNLSEFITRQ